MRALIVIATYNERDNLPLLIDRIGSVECPLDILVVDDNSPDGTGDIAESLAASNPALNVLHRNKKEGLGPALRSAFVWSLKRGYDRVINIDGDLSHDPLDIPKILFAAKKADVVIGSRYFNGIRVINWPPRRLFLSLCAAKYVQLVTRMPFKDPTSGFRCFRGTALAGILSEFPISHGYSYHIEVAFKAWAAGMNIVEVPIVFTDRIHGSTKLSKRIIAEALWIPWLLMAKNRVGWKGKHLNSPGQ